MPTPAQGLTFTGLPSGLTNVKVKQTGVDVTDSKNRLDASTLDLAVGSDRVYVNGLPDAGSGAVSGVTKTITCQFLSTSAPSAGDTTTYEGTTYKYTDVEIEYSVGELVKGSATLVSIPD
jgi:hypothetical protein